MYIFLLLQFLNFCNGRESCKNGTSCGDVCLDYLISINSDYTEEEENDCVCGNEAFSTYLDDKFCCVPPSESSSAEFCWKDDETYTGHCPLDKSPAFVIDTSRSCHGECYKDLRYNKPENEYLHEDTDYDYNILPPPAPDIFKFPTDEKVVSEITIVNQVIVYDDTDRFHCSSGDLCVELKNICRGVALCPDKSDLQLCNDTLQNVKYCGYGGVRKHLETELVKHSFCQYSDEKKEYETIARTDVSSIIPEFSHNSFKYVNEDNGNDNWDHLKLLELLELEYETENFDCNYLEDNSFKLLNLGLECSNKDCYYPLGGGGQGGSSGCSDKSDQVYNIGLECKPISLVENVKTAACNAKDPHIIVNTFCFLSPEESEELQQNLTEKFFYTSFLTNCQSSCSQSIAGCQACTNPRYFNCTKNDIPVCIHPNLVCDGLPDCDSSIDESDCLDQYFTRNIVSPHATFQCPKYQYPGFPIYCKILFF